MNEHGEKMTADSFYDEKLKQKQEEDGVGDHSELTSSGYFFGSFYESLKFLK